jgi:hypothetical protein
LPELHFELNGEPAYLITEQKRTILELGFVIMRPDEVWAERLGTETVEVDGATAKLEPCLESNRLAIALMELQDAVEQDIWQQDRLYRGDVDDA